MKIIIIWSIDDIFGIVKFSMMAVCLLQASAIWTHLRSTTRNVNIWGEMAQNAIFVSYDLEFVKQWIVVSEGVDQCKN